jgi:hypothetical protein
MRPQQKKRRDIPHKREVGGRGRRGGLVSIKSPVFSDS